jgi:hypothetical protein
MDILAGLFDPGENGFDIADMSVVVGILLAVGGVVAGVVRWNAKRVATVRDRERAEMERRLAEQIREATKPIQPDANGGWALADSIRLTHEVLDDVRYLRKRLDEHITWHIENRED